MLSGFTVSRYPVLRITVLRHRDGVVPPFPPLFAGVEERELERRTLRARNRNLDVPDAQAGVRGLAVFVVLPLVQREAKAEA